MMESDSNRVDPATHGLIVVAWMRLVPLNDQTADLKEANTTTRAHHSSGTGDKGTCSHVSKTQLYERRAAVINT